MTGKILIVSNTSWSLFNFRLGLLRSLEEDGWEVVTSAPQDAHSSLVRREFRWIRIRHLNRRGYNPFQDFVLLLELVRIFLREKPDLVLSFTIKPNLYSALAAKLTGAKSICSVTGLGYSHDRFWILSYIVTLLYRWAFRLADRIAFQNREDFLYFIEKRIIKKAKGFLTPGSGVDLRRFTPTDSDSAGRNPEAVQILFVGRMLWDKGIGEYVAAARAVKRNHGSAQFSLLGPIDSGNPNGIEFESIRKWEQEGVVRYLGSTDDVRPFLEKADIFVLPSYYREGVPRVLLEAMAMGKPIVTTDSAGCREAVEQGKNGFLVPVRDSRALSEAVTRLIEMDRKCRERMGKASRCKVENGYDERFVVRKYKKAINEIIKGK